MAQNKKASSSVDDSDLVLSAVALEGELRKFEELAHEARRISLSTEKGLTRAARAVNEAAEAQEKIVEQVRALGAVILAQQARQESAAGLVAKRASEINERVSLFAEHMRTFAGLGAAAGEITAMLEQLSSQSPSPGEPPNDRASTLLSDIDGRMNRLVEGADRLAAAASQDDMADIAKQADALKQRISAVRGRLGLSRPVASQDS